ncbi:hypothetical protein D5F51_07530 [Yersinia hibernica]|uniref:Transmembrane protein n=2 Tax=Yersinia TaxID=629 RepID=A0ABX5QYG0_9GAMM|nr:hypothetical protein CBW54_21600 [Yersinia kristensenii]QAX78422.1 hypothetical protein D5F51_07530 [Yersinia hibernica]
MQLILYVNALNSLSHQHKFSLLYLNCGKQINPAKQFQIKPISRGKIKAMASKRLHAKHWKMFVVLLCICGALMLLRWASMIFG